MNNKKFLLPLLLPLFGIVFWGIYFLQGEKKFDKMVKELTKKTIDGLIIKSVELNRGFYLIEIRESNSINKYSLPKSWFFKENNIQAGDSISKEGNSNVITFFKFKDGVFIKCCHYEISM